MADKKYLTSTYDIETSDEIRDHYNEWSESYDRELEEHGYVTPQRCAQALKSVGTPPNSLILDFGCGTGVSGAAFHHEGFANLIGCDVSPEMLRLATDKGLYQQTFIIEPGAKVEGRYDVVAAVGVIGVGAAPPEAFDIVMQILNPGGRFVFSYNDKALSDPRFTEKLIEHIKKGASLIFEEHGDHIPGIGLFSTVYVLQAPS